ncbi:MULTISPECIES: hypothetical protein [Pseudomonas fluorescens group]|uniref:hypothetical protein n=1 Tax=Pseudomonas fluorescens group TaxID=136843 RepID=UPI00128BAD32|nr:MULTISPECIES: hypothetical protein [Pseudomonas fluorescens group]MBA1429226.1 hypothetical protein [Pseudomonas orientalis]
MTKEQLAARIASAYKYVDPITTKEIDEILQKIRLIQIKNNGKISEKEAEEVIYKVLSGRTVFSLSSVDTTDTTNLLQQIIAAAKNNVKPKP